MPPAPTRARGDTRRLALGPGYLWIAGALGTPEPDDLDTDWEAIDPGWFLLGYTETGSEFNYALATGEVEVAEELDPVRITTTGRTGSLVFTMAEMTASHLSIAMNGGVITYAGMPSAPPGMSDDIVVIEPPDLGQEFRYKFGFESEDHQERWIFRQAFQTGTMKITRQKGTTIAGIAVTFSLEKPTSGLRLFKIILDREVRGGWLVPDIAPRPPAPATVAPASLPQAGGARGALITGTHMRGVTEVTFGGVDATGVTPGTNPDSQVNCVVPDGAAAGAVDVVVGTAAGLEGTLTNGFTYT